MRQAAIVEETSMPGVVRPRHAATPDTSGVGATHFSPRNRFRGRRCIVSLVSLSVVSSSYIFLLRTSVSCREDKTTVTVAASLKHLILGEVLFL